MASTKIEQALDLLETTKKKVYELLAEIPDFQLRTDNVIERLINGIKHSQGIAPTSAINRPATQRQPLTKVAGIEIGNTAVTLTKKALSVDKKVVDDFKFQVQKAYDEFLSIENSEMKERYTPAVVRGVAAMAGINVTPTEPKKITPEFIDKVKAAIKEKQEKEAAYKKATEGSDGQGASVVSTEDNDDNTSKDGK
jgi:hypothetical protein